MRINTRDDIGIDEVVLVDADGVGFIRAVVCPRYKTSYMSGDEWRTSIMWQKFKDGEWINFDGGYGDMQTAMAAIYPGVYTSHKEWHEKKVGYVDFKVKGAIKFRATYQVGDEKPEPKPLLTVVGHLPWALITAAEQGSPVGTDRLCSQYGCAEPHTTVYELINQFTREGVKRPKSESLEKYLGRPTRAFCARHARRGNCGLDDADNNYTVISGHGPSGGVERVDDRSRAKTVIIEAD